MDTVAFAGPQRWRTLLYPYRLHPGWWCALSAALVGTDYAVGPQVEFADMFVVPVFLAAWYSGRSAALTLAVALPLVLVLLTSAVSDQPTDVLPVVGTAAARTLVFAFVAIVLSRLADHERTLLRQMEILEGMFPICMHCKNIQSGPGQWESLEGYLEKRSETRFTHGLCDRCFQQHYPVEFAAEEIERRRWQ